MNITLSTLTNVYSNNLPKSWMYHFRMTQINMINVWVFVILHRTSGVPVLPKNGDILNKVLVSFISSQYWNTKMVLCCPILKYQYLRHKHTPPLPTHPHYYYYYYTFIFLLIRGKSAHLLTMGLKSSHTEMSLNT